MALAEVWAEIDPSLRTFWVTLMEEEGNQSKVARKLGIHRNTARAWRERIEEVLRRHGFIRFEN
jgi:transposase-like protein